MASTDQTPSTPHSLGSNLSQNTRPPRPKIVLPPPQINIQTNPMYTANIPVTPNNPQEFPFHMYPTKAGEFMFKQFSGFKDFTFNTAKSGMSFGEKIAFWMYNKISFLGKQWFTHIFLFIVILLFSVGGAFLFVAIEGNEEDLTLGNVDKLRRKVLEDLKNITLRPSETTSADEQEGESYRRLLDYENDLYDEWQTKALIIANRGDKIWTFWNAIFYCGTIYTTIVLANLNLLPRRGAAEGMRIPRTNISWGTPHHITEDKNSAVRRKTMGTVGEPVDQLDQPQPPKPAEKSSQDDDKPSEPSDEPHRFEGKVTAEQELSASLARRRRNISKKRSSSASRPRDQTPVREITALPRASDEEQVSTPPPKTPERRKSRSGPKTEAESLESTVDSQNAEPEVAPTPDPTESSIKKPQAPAEVEEQEKPTTTKASTNQKERKEPKASSSKEEISSLLNRAKQSATSKEKSTTRVRKEVRKATVKRSQSAPREKLENLDDDLVESFKKAQLLSTALELDKPGKIEVERSSSDVSSSSSEKPKRPTSIPIFSNILRRRKLKEERTQTEKESSKVLAESQKTGRLTFKEIRQGWMEFKVVYSGEYAKITSLKNRCISDVIILMIFCGLGGIMFKFTEGTFENFYKCGVKRVKRDFIDALWRGSHHLREDDWKSLARTKLRDFEEQLHTAHEAGVTTYSGQRSWSFLNGIVYALTVVTTIGYGHMYPITATGRALTIVYAIFGIPLFLIVLTDFGKLFTRSIKFLWAFVRRLYYTGTCKQARKTTAMQEVMKGAQMMYEIATFRRPSQYNLDEDPNAQNGPPKFPAVSNASVATPHSKDETETPNTPAPSTFEIDDEFNLPISVAIFLLVGYIFLGAVFYFLLEQWDFFASFYFVFISMSTIGFGDYVPRDPLCMIGSIIYLVFGLALMSMCINVVQVKLSDTFRQASAKLGATIGLTVAEEDGSIATIPPPVVEIAEVHSSAKSV